MVVKFNFAREMRRLCRSVYVCIGVCVCVCDCDGVCVCLTDFVGGMSVILKSSFNWECHSSD